MGRSAREGGREGGREQWMESALDTGDEERGERVQES